MLINTWILRSFLSFSLISLIKKLLSSDIQYLVVQISSWKLLGSSNFNIFLNLWGHEKVPSVRRLIPCFVFALSFLDSENKWLNIQKEEVGQKKGMVQKEEGEGPSWRKHLEAGRGLGDGGGEWRRVTEDAQGPRLVASVTEARLGPAQLSAWASWTSSGLLARERSWDLLSTALKGRVSELIKVGKNSYLLAS